MAVIDTLRPTAVVSSTDWTITPSGTAADVTSDDSDLTYVEGQIGDDSLVLSVGAHGVPAGHRRHLARTRARGRDGQVTASVRLPTGSATSNVAFSALNFGETGSFTNVNGSWGGGLPPTTSGDFGITVTVESSTTAVDIAELYVDIDSRAQPTYDPQVSDGTTVTTTITATSAPVVEIINVDTDSLPVSRWRAWVTLQGDSTPVWDTGSVSGNPVATQTDPLENDSYTLHVQLWSILGDDSEYEGAEDTLDFTVNLQAVAPPIGISVQQVADTPLFEIIAETPLSFADYDDEPYVEIQRSACGGADEGGWITLDLVGPATVTGSVSYVDWTAPRTLNVEDCDDPTICTFSYRVRLVGTLDGLLVTSAWLLEEDGGSPVTHSLQWPDSDIILRTRDSEGVLWLAVCGTAAWDVDKPFTAQLGIMGGQQVTSGAPGEHDLSLSLAVESQEDLERLEQILERQLILVSPADSTEQWSAPSTTGVQILTIRGVRTVSVSLVGTGPEPAHSPGEVLE